jgi:hypothetical protein
MLTWRHGLALIGYRLIEQRGCWGMAKPKIEFVLSEIEKALASRLHFAAITMSLTLPDVCAALESLDGRSTFRRYTEWYKANVTTFSHLTAEHCYSLRCGVVHQAQTVVKGQRYKRVIFVPPESAQIQEGVDHDALLFNTDFFCDSLIESVRRWYEANHSNPTVLANLPGLVEVRPDGYPNYFVGMSAIA